MVTTDKHVALFTCLQVRPWNSHSVADVTESVVYFFFTSNVLGSNYLFQSSGLFDLLMTLSSNAPI